MHSFKEEVELNPVLKVIKGIIKEEENPGKGNSRSSARRPGKTPRVWGTASTGCCLSLV